jgi:hypothetical protein
VPPKRPDPRSVNRRRSTRSAPTPQGLAAFLPAARVDFLGPDESRWLRRFKWLIGLALVPLCWVLVETFLVLLQADTLAARYWKSPEFAAFGLGCFAWMVLFFGFRNRLMVWLYVAGHELTHALFVLIFLGRVSQIHISSGGGHILTDRNNFVISLAPYFFPFYTAVAIIAWAVLQWVFRDSGSFNPIWLYASIGFTWMFHLSFTVWMIRRDQPDVDQNGRLFSFSIIFLTNLLLICAMLIIASPTATFAGFGLSFWENARSFGVRLTESLREMILMWRNMLRI